MASLRGLRDDIVVLRGKRRRCCVQIFEFSVRQGEAEVDVA